MHICCLLKVENCSWACWTECLPQCGCTQELPLYTVPPVWWSSWKDCAEGARSQTDSSSAPSASAGWGTACHFERQTVLSALPHPNQRQRLMGDLQWTQTLEGAPLERQFPESPGPAPKGGIHTNGSPPGLKEPVLCSVKLILYKAWT